MKRKTFQWNLQTDDYVLNVSSSFVGKWVKFSNNLFKDDLLNCVCLIEKFVEKW